MGEKEMEELHPDELVPVKFQGPLLSPPKELTAPLLPFQTEGMSWMYNQEVCTEVKGGILADEMGMGKTLQSITVILKHKSKLQHAKPNSKYPPNISLEETVEFEKEDTLWDQAMLEWKHEIKMMDIPNKLFSKKFPHRGGTLVICPLIALY